MSNMGPIDKEEFSKLAAKTQRSIMYGYLLELNAAVKRQQRQNWFDKASSFMGGVLGGAAAVATKMAIWRASIDN